VWIPIDPFVNSAGKILKWGHPPIGWYQFIPQASSDEAATAAVKFLDWASIPDNIIHIIYGEEGVHFERSRDRVISRTDVPWETAWYDKAWMLSGQAVTSEAELTARASQFPGYEPIIAQADLMMLNGVKPRFAFPVPIDAERRYRDIVREKQVDFIVQIVVADPEDVEKNYNSAIEELLDLGARQIIEERASAYDEAFGN